MKPAELIVQTHAAHKTSLSRNTAQVTLQNHTHTNINRYMRFSLINYDLNPSLLTMITGCVEDTRTRPEEGTEEGRDRSTASCDELRRERSSN